MRRALTIVVGTLAMLAGCTAATTTYSTATAAQRCARSIGTSGNADSVTATMTQTCGRSYRSVGFWGGGTHDGYHYGTYTKVNGKSSVACAVSGCTAGIVQWGGYQRKTDGKIFCTIHCALAHTAAAPRCTNECVLWQYRGTHNPPDFRAQWVNGNSGGWFIRGVAHCADGRNEKLYEGGWVTSLGIWSEAHCQSPYLDEIGGAYDLKTCSNCSFVRHWKVGHVKLTALACTIQNTFQMFDAEHAMDVNTGNTCGEWVRARIRCVVQGGSHIYTYGDWVHVVPRTSNAAFPSNQCTDGPPGVVGQPDQSGYQYSPDKVSKQFVLCWKSGLPISGVCNGGSAADDRTQ